MNVSNNCSINCVGPSLPNSLQIFQDLLNYLKAVPNFYQLLLIYKKNLLFFKESKKMPQQMPDFDEIELSWVRECTKDEKKHNRRSDICVNKKGFLIWLVAVFELLTQKSFNEFENNDWFNLSAFLPSAFLPKLDGLFKLKLQVFSFLKTRHQIKTWTNEQDDTLKSAIRMLSPFLFQPRSNYLKVSWSDIAFEFSKEIQKTCCLKTDKQCKERWFNHLSPFLNKTSWNLHDDIQLMTENLKNPKEWAQISRMFPGRTQHQIKNRFICLLAKTSGLSREKIRISINQNLFFGLIYHALEMFKDEELKIPHEEINLHEEIQESNQDIESFFKVSKEEELEKFLNFNYEGDPFSIDFD